jgi:hypothetical protein
MTTYQQWSNYEFETLTVPGDQWRLDLLADASRTTTNQKPFGFETMEACWAEDDRRAISLNLFPRELCEGIDGCNPAGTARLLADGMVHKWIQRCSASAAYMRDRRIALLGSVLKLTEDNPQRQIAFITVSHPAWYFNLRHNWSYPRRLSEDFCDLLEGGNVLSASGFLVAVLSGRYDPAAQNIQLILRGICAGDKLSRFIDMETDCETVPRMFNWDVHEIVHLPRQIRSMMPNRITELPERWKGRKQIQRMREPYHSIYLMWLARSPFAQLVLSDGVVVDKQRGLVVETD